MSATRRVVLITGAASGIGRAAAKLLRAARKPLIIGLVAALILGLGGFYVVWSGLLFGHPTEEHAADVAPLPDIAFVPVQPLTICSVLEA